MNKPFVLYDDANDVTIVGNYHLFALAGKLMVTTIHEKGYNNPALYSMAKQMESLDRVTNDEFYKQESED